MSEDDNKRGPGPHMKAQGLVSELSNKSAVAITARIEEVIGVQSEEDFHKFDMELDSLIWKHYGVRLVHTFRMKDMETKR